MIFASIMNCKKLMLLLIWHKDDQNTQSATRDCYSGPIVLYTFVAVSIHYLALVPKD